MYRKVLYLKQESYEILIEMKDKMEQYIELNRGFAKMRIQFDFDPMSGFLKEKGRKNKWQLEKSEMAEKSGDEVLNKGV